MHLDTNKLGHDFVIFIFFNNNSIFFFFFENKNGISWGA